MLDEYKFVIEKWPTRFRELVTLTARQLQLTPFLNPQHSFEPNNIGTPKNLTSINIRYHIENEATKCGKTVFIASRSDLAAELHFLRKRYHTTKFYEGVDSILY